MSGKSKFFKVLILVFIAMSVLMLLPEMAEAQCRMCAAGAESNLKNGGTEGQGLNQGILYLLAMPYLLVGVLGFIWWRGRKKLDLGSE